MGGIVGLWNRDGRPVDEAVWCRMRQTLAHRQDVAGLAIPSERLSIAFDGRLDNRDELPEAGTDGEVALAAYRAYGDEFAVRLSGDFALAIFDPARRSLILARDPIGVRPLYYHVTPDVVLFASEIKAILAHPAVRTRPNDEVLADYLFNLLAADDTRGVTFFEDVFAVLPAHVATATEHRVVTKRYWDFDPAQRVAVRTFEEAAEGFREHFTRAVHRRLRPRAHIAISVSGGLDSSAIFCTAETLRRKHGGPALDGVSYIVPDGRASDEKAYLAEIERMYGVAITKWIDLPQGTVDGSVEGIRHAEAPMLDARWSGTLAYYHAIRALGATTLLTGHWGDQVLVEHGFLVDLLRRGAWQTAWRDFSEYRRWKDHGAGDIGRNLPRAVLADVLPAPLLAALRSAQRRLDERGQRELTAWYTPAFRDKGREALRRRSAAGPEQAFPTAHARAIYRQARSRYHVQSMEWNNKVAAMHGMDAAFPFLDRDLIAYLIALPGELQTHRGIPKAVLRQAMKGVLPEAIASRRSKADFSADVNAETAQDYDKLVARLGAGTRAAAFGYARADAANHTVRPSPDADTCSLSWALKDLLSLELWLEEFFATPTEHSDHA
jgi:asparagine synthase (glutamine-hydrolysing)